MSQVVRIVFFYMIIIIITKLLTNDYNYNKKIVNIMYIDYICPLKIQSINFF